MAFAKKELALQTYNGVGTSGFRHYQYTNTNGDTITSNNYFNDASDQLYDGDIITNGTDGFRYRVTVSGSGAVTVTKIGT